MHKYVADVELKNSTSLQELIACGEIDIVDYDAYIDRENDENYREYFKLAYEKMNRYDFPDNQDIYTYHCNDENLGEIRSIYMAMRMNCMYFMSDDSGARSFVKNTFTSKKRLETMSVYDALKKCCDLKTSISLKQLNPVIHQIFRERQDRLKNFRKCIRKKIRQQKSDRVNHCIIGANLSWLALLVFYFICKHHAFRYSCRSCKYR